MTETQWLTGVAAAVIVGVSKTGLPGVGLLAAPMMAHLFGGRASVGLMLPVLLFGDCFAVVWYRQHARWDKLKELAPWVLIGMAAGGALLWAAGKTSGQKDFLNLCIGVLVLAMLAIHLARARWRKQLAAHSRWNVLSAGTAAGFATTVSNAAGSIMGVYMTSLGLPKEELMGTTAWFYFLVNLVKLPIFFLLTYLEPTKPIFTLASLRTSAALFPYIFIGVLLGKWALPRVPQKLFDNLVLLLAALAALKLIFE